MSLEPAGDRGGPDPRPAALPAEWDRWRLDRNRRGLRTALYMNAVLYPAFGVLDWFLAPAAALPTLWATRALVLAVTLVLFPVSRSRVFERHGERVTSTYAWLAAGGISVMTSYMGGLGSPYYAGLCLILLAIGLLFVWRPPTVAATHGSIVVTFVLINAGLGTVGPAGPALSNLAFLAATSLIAGVGQVFQYRTQREQHGQRARLEETSGRLSRAHAELQQLAEFKSRFFANMTHELRTPLALILTPLELALQGEGGTLSEAQRGSFQTMLRSAQKLLRLINDLMDLSRLEESRLRLRVAERDLVGQVRGLLADTAPLARRKDISVSFDTALPAAPVCYDAERIERVLVNLLSNAIKFTPAGGHVAVRIRPEPAAVRVEVSDDGPGFPPQLATRIFERFYQVDMAGTRRHGGTGIGLALARELVVLHGGRIEATSEGASGATFAVTLPTGRAHVRPDEWVDAAVDPAEEAGAPLDWAVDLASRHDFRLLDIEEATERRIVERDADEAQRAWSVVVVEDSAEIVRLVHTTLHRDFRVFAAPDGLKGLELVRRERPHLVVTDLMMPGIDGLELTRRLREDETTRHIPILMLTARGALDDRVAGLETGVSAYLVKPFQPRELVTAARRLVQSEEDTADLVLHQRMESLEIVAAGLAHELNNPLNYVKNALARVKQDAAVAVELVRETRTRALDAPEAARLERAGSRMGEMLEVAAAGLKRIGGTVELMSRYGRSGFRRELAACDAFEAARTAVGVVLPATGRRVDVQFELSGDGQLECVPEELSQVVTNLVQNAIEASPDPGGRIVIRGEGQAAQVVLSVRDNGPGVPADVRARLFTPFFTTKGPGRGQGLGLTIVRRVVTSLGGDIRVGDAPGGGAEFVVRLPRKPRDLRQPAQAALPFREAGT